MVLIAASVAPRPQSDRSPSNPTGTVMNEIFVLDPDGGAPLQLTDNNVFDGNPD